MLIRNLGPFEADGARGVQALVEYETRSEDACEIFATTESPYFLRADPNAFLVGAFLPGWTAGEPRIRIEGAVCPLLTANLAIAASVLQTWFKDLPAVPRIECDYEYRQSGNRVGAFLSGGVDSLSMVRRLTTLLPAGHPDRPTATIVVDYQDMGRIARGETDSRFARSVDIARDVGAEVGLDVIPIRSNFCRLNCGMSFWMHRYHGSFLASMMHFLSREFRLGYVASTFPANHLAPWGSHPLLDPYYSSQHVRIQHYGVEETRLDKVRDVAGWPLALRRMYVCTSNSSNGRNCGSCEKCVRTKLHLLVTDRLKDAPAFDQLDVTRADIDGIRIGSEYAYQCYQVSLAGLLAMGRVDHYLSVDRALHNYTRRRSESKFARTQRRVIGRLVGTAKRVIPFASWLQGA
jgi:hypothetical protein